MSEWLLGIFVVLTAIGLSGLLLVFCTFLLYATAERRHSAANLWPLAAGLLAAALATAASLGVYGYDFGTNAYHVQQLPLIERLGDASVFPRDPYVETAKSFPSHFARMLGWLVQREAEQGRSPERLFWFLHLGASFLTFLAFYALSHSLFQDTWGAVLSLALFVVSQPLHLATPLAMDVVGRSHFDLTTAAWPIAFFILTLWSLHFTGLASLVAGFLGYVHPLMGGQLLAVLTAASLYEAVFDRREHWALRIATAFVPGALAGLPLWAGMVRAGTLSGDGVAEAMRVWFPAHSFASSWTFAHWLFAVPLLLICAQAVWRARRYEEYRHRFPALLAGLALLWAGGLLFGEGLGWDTVLKAQLYRTDALLLVMALAAVGHDIRKYWGHSRATTWCLGGVLAMAFAGPPKPAYLLLAGGLWLLWEWANEREFEPYGPTLMAALKTLAAAFAVLSLASLWGDPRSAWTFGPEQSLATLFLLTAMGLGWWKAVRIAPWAMRVGTAAVLVAALYPAVHAGVRRLSIGALSPVSPVDREKRELAGWAAKETGPEDLFVVPPGEDFRLSLRRPVAFEWVDGAAMHWRPGFAAAWRRRAGEFGVDEAAMREWWRRRDRETFSGADGTAGPSPVETGFRSLTEAQLAALAAKHQAAYLIAYADMPVFKKHFRQAAAGRTFRVYQYLYNYTDKS